MDQSKATKTRDLLIARLQERFGFSTKKDAERVLENVTGAIIDVLKEHADEDKFVLKVSGFGKFTVRQRPGSMRKIPFTGKMKMTDPKRKIKFSTFGELRRLEKSTATEDAAQ